jgi:polyribonucleotide nucleotidyltransferase
MKQQHSVTIEEFGITISTGSIGRLANGAVTIRKGDTTLFVSATAADTSTVAAKACGINESCSCIL